MRDLRVALGLIVQDGYYVLQLRQGDPSIGSVGLIGTFGGKIEDGESPLQAVVREIGEETNLEIVSHGWKPVGQVRVISDYDNEEVLVKATAFVTVVKPDVKIIAREGTLVRIKMLDISKRVDKFTPATKAMFETLL